MSAIEHDVGAVLVNSDIDKILTAFRAAGFNTKNTWGDEHLLTSEAVELHISPFFAGESANSGNLLVSGEIECRPEELGPMAETLVKLFSRADACYRLEIESGDGTEPFALEHPDFAYPDPKRLEKAVSFETGNPYQPYGGDRIVVQPNGSFRYERREGTTVTNRASGKLSQAAIAGLAAELVASRFPHVADHDVPPGGGNLTIAIGENERVMVNMSTARKFVGYGHLIERVHEWLHYLTNPDPKAEVPRGMDVRSKEVRSRFARGFTSTNPISVTDE